MIKHRVYIPIYNCYLTIIVSKNFESEAKKYGFGDDTLGSEAMVRARSNVKTGIIDYIYIQRPSITYGTIAHEAKHIVNYIFTHKGLKLDTDNDEAECYLLAYIVDLIIEKIQK